MSKESRSPLDILPIELLACILSELDIVSLISASAVSKLFRSCVESTLLNPWRQPIRRVLISPELYEPAFTTLGARLIVPRQNWIEILSLARIEWLLFEAVLPNLKEDEWEQAFKKRWLPSVRKWKRDGKWKQAFMKTLTRICHRLGTSCTADESWTKYVVLNRNGSANSCEAYSRTFNPLAVYDELKLQSNLTHLETQQRLLVQFPDVRVIVLGVLHHSSSLFVNSNARQLLHPPGVQSWEDEVETASVRSSELSVPSAAIAMNSAAQVDVQPPPPPRHANPNPYTPLLRAGYALTRTRSNELPPQGRSFVRTASRDSDPPPRDGIFRRLTFSVGDRVVHSIGVQPGSSIQETSATVPDRVTPVGTPAQDTPVETTNGFQYQTAMPTTAGSTSVGPSQANGRATQPIAPSFESHSTDPSTSPRLQPRPFVELPYPPLRHPTPIPAHRYYPNYTSGGGDSRWRGKGSLLDLDEGGKLWAGPMMIIAQLVRQDSLSLGDDLNLTGQSKFMSFTIDDLSTVAPWMEERITKTIDGMGLGNM